MKKFLLIFINIIIVLNISGCSKEMASSTKSDYEIKSAQILVDNYLKYIIKKDGDNAKKLLGKGMEKTVSFDNNLDIWGYKFDEITQIGNSGLLKVLILKGSPDKPYSLLEKYNIKTEKVDDEYKITEIVKKPEKELFLEDILGYRSLMVKEKDKLETNPLLNTGSVPKYVSSKDNKASTYSMEVSSVDFGPAALSYTGDKAVFSTKYKGDCYFALVSIGDSAQTSSTGSKGTSQQGGDQSSGQSQNPIKPIGTKLTNLDYLLNSKILYISFTVEEKFVIVGYKGKGGNSIRIYYSASGELIPYKFEDNFSQDKYNVVYLSSDKKYIYFSVSPVNKESDSKAGLYRIKMEDFKIDRI
jgi:hypothetical protein